MNNFENRNRGTVSREGVNRTISSQRTTNSQGTANRAPSDGRVAGVDRVFYEKREAPTRPMQNSAPSRSGYYGDSRAQGKSTANGRSQSRSGHRTYNSRSYAKKHVKRIDLEPKVIMIALSILVTAAVAVGVIVNYWNKVNDIIPPENEGQNTEISQNNGTSVSHTLDLYSLDRTEVDPELDFPKVKIYDGQGREIFSPVRKKDGRIDGTIVYEYNDEGNCIVEKLYGADGILVYKNVSGGKSDGTAKTVYETQFDGKNNFSGYTEALYDDKGVVLEKVQYSHNGVAEAKYKYEYDDSGRVSRENRYTIYGELSVYTDYKYDAFNNVIEKVQCDSNGKAVLRDVMEYDSENRIIREEHYAGDICKSYTEYTYDSEGNANTKHYILKDEYTMTYVESEY